MLNQKTWHLALLGSYLVVLVWSVIGPVDYLIWGLEVGPVIVGGIVLIATYRRFPLSHLTYGLLWGTAIIMTIGGHYTYEMVPFFDYLRDAFHLRRNHYDRVGHFVQGLTLAVLIRELFLRKSRLLPGLLLGFVVTCICLALSASYEIFEFAGSAFMGKSAEAFLGLQGDVWDSQKDMLLALSGAVCGLLLFSRYQNRHVWEAGR